jgi:hypothetical protein
MDDYHSKRSFYLLQAKIVILQKKVLQSLQHKVGTLNHFYNVIATQEDFSKELKYPLNQDFSSQKKKIRSKTSQNFTLFSKSNFENRTPDIVFGSAEL